ncbi:MAG: hypothetical protein NT164_07060 [Verrucomicrobiae bacterium]|nr:hypothetical protein [Verrucomicrobiae bacterium]
MEKDLKNNQLVVKKSPEEIDPKHKTSDVRQDARINIRLPKHDLTKIKQRAAHEGLPYQTLIASLLHKYAKGHLA